jgi:hypothetical protein
MGEHLGINLIGLDLRLADDTGFKRMGKVNLKAFLLQ